MDGPGTHLWNLLKTVGFKERKGCGCRKYRDRMDRKGITWCKNHKELILKWMKDGASQRRLPFSRFVAGWLIDAAISNAEKERKVNQP